VAWACATPALTDWDSWCYASEAARAKPSILCLGRWWFIALMRWAYQLAAPLGIDAVHAYEPMRIAVALLTAGAVVALMHWTFLLTARRGAAVWAGLVALASPTLAAYCSAVMTEGPTLLFLVLAFLAWELSLGAAGRARPTRFSDSSLALLAGLSFGVAVDMREPVATLLAWPVVSCFIDRPARRWRLLGWLLLGAALTLSLGVVMAWAWRPEQDPLSAFLEWADYMRQERARSLFDPAMNAAFLLVHYAAASPAGVLVFLGWLVLLLRGWAKGGSDGIPRRLKWMAVSTVPLAVSTWYNPNLSFNYRLLLPLAWMLAPVLGVMGERLENRLRTKPPAKREAPIGPGEGMGRGSPLGTDAPIVTGPCRIGGAFILICAVGVLLVAGAFGARLVPHFDWAEHQDRLFRDLQRLPDNAVILAGPGCPAAKYLRDLGVRPRWQVVLTNYDFAGRFDPGAWAGDKLAAAVERQLRAGRRVFLNVNPKGWTGAGDYHPEWDSVREAIRRVEHRPAAGAFVELVPAGR
jgi:hypothetical protein